MVSQVLDNLLNTFAGLLFLFWLVNWFVE
jgi:hypothetical protein